MDFSLLKQSMIIKQPSLHHNKIHVVFELPSSIWADTIYLVGTFQHSRFCTISMHQQRDGAWRVGLELVAGECYAFYYLVNGSRQTDFRADGTTEINGVKASIINLSSNQDYVTHRHNILTNDLPVQTSASTVNSGLLIKRFVNDA